MSTAIIDDIDWVGWMAKFATADSALFTGDDAPYDDVWVRTRCRRAALTCLGVSPLVRVRLRKGRLSEEDFAQVVCEMVLRLAKSEQYKSESNGSYSYQRNNPQPDPPGYSPTLRLFVSKDDRTVLLGSENPVGGTSHISLGLDPGYGG